jgi:hypothetical protein
MTMAWYSLNNNKWVVRLAPVTQTVRANTDPAVEAKEGEEVGGKVLIRISWDDVQACLTEPPAADGSRSRCPQEK